jgi:hypothetical protein
MPAEQPAAAARGPDQPLEAHVEALRAALAGLRYGQVVVVVHDGRIVQIERTERRRFQPSAGSPA